MKFCHFAFHLSSVVISFTGVVLAHSQSRDGISSISTIEDFVINTRNGHVHHLSDFDLTFSINKVQQIKLQLEPNHDILGENAQVQYLDVHGNIRRSVAIARHEHKVFKGSVWTSDKGGEWSEAGWARVYLKRDGDKPLMEGSFTVSGDHHHVKLRSTYSQTRRESDVELGQSVDGDMIVYRDSDMAGSRHSEVKRDEDNAPTCGADNLAFNLEPDHPIFRERSDEQLSSWNPRGFAAAANPKKRQSGNIGTGNLRSTIGDTTGCPTESRVALVGIATDCTYTASFSNEEALRQNVINLVNSASNVYERTFRITLGIQNLTISDSQCPATAASTAPWNVPCSEANIEDRLELFSRWRGGLNDGTNPNAFWTLLSTCGTGSSVGLAWLGQLCVGALTGYGGQSVSGANVVVRTPSEWQVFAHEVGHTFGAVHDCDSTQCASSSGASRCCPISSSGCDAGGQYLMSPVSSSQLDEFSPCSIGNICSGLGRNRVQSSCLSANRNLTTITGSQCGNGIVEAGEDCDCGGAEGCGRNSCCDPTTCRFTRNSVCDDSNDSCCTSCQFTAAGTVCRASTGVCDLEETCSGSTSTCPSDEFLPNGDSCGNSTGQTCASGVCTSRALQCQTVFDPMSSGNYTDACDSSSCALVCASGSTRTSCAQMDQNFLDGTPCSGGQCRSGRCRSTNGGNPNSDIFTGGGNNGGGGSAGDWFNRNRSLVIGLAAGLGGLFVLLLLCCFVSCCRSSRKKKKLAALGPQQPLQRQQQAQMGQQYWDGPMPPAYPSYPGAAHTSYNGGQGRLPLVRYA